MAAPMCTIRRAPLALTALIALLALLAAACTQRQDPASERFLYVVNCVASVDKLDTQEGKRIATFNLAERSALVPLLASAASGLDGCIAERVAHDVAAKQVHVVVPTQTRLSANGSRDFQLLTFALPDWAFVSAQLAGNGLEDAPYLQRSADGALRVQPARDWTAVTEIDLREYKGAAQVSGNQIIESSGGVSLLRLFTGEPNRLLLALADQSARTLTPLTDLPSTTALNVHLAPGGGFVLVEVTEPTGTPARRTGALRLYDGSGKTVADLADEAVGTMSFLALTPNGLAIYHMGSDYRFVAVAPKGQRFGSAPVTQPLPDARPALVFAAQ